MKIETELISHELGMSYLRPRNKTKEIVEALIGFAAIIAFVSLLLWVASITG